MFEWTLDGCAVCGRAWNDWCVEHHLPYSRQTLVEAEAEVARLRMKIEAGERFLAAKQLSG